MYFHPFNKMFQDAAMYDLLANYYKYLDPQKHMYYYQLHFSCMQQICQTQHQQNLYRSQSYYRTTAKVRVFHASPDAPAVDIYVNDEKTLENMNYYQISPYLDLPAGSYQVDVYPAGQTTNPVLTDTIRVEAGKNYTVSAAGLLTSLQLIPVVDTTTTAGNKSMVRFLHLSPNAPEVDITTEDGHLLFTNIGFGQATEYLELEPGTVTLNVKVSGTDTNVLTLRNTALAANQAYTIVAIGIVEGSPRLEALIFDA